MSTEKKLRFETLQLHVGQENPDLGRSSVTRMLPCFDVGNDGAVFGN